MNIFKCSSFVSNTELYIGVCKEARTKTYLTNHSSSDLSFPQPKLAILIKKQQNVKTPQLLLR